MQTLIFNTTTKKVKFSNYNHEVTDYENISTIKCSELGFYEVMQKINDEPYTTIPILRIPIANTNMRIEK